MDSLAEQKLNLFRDNAQAFVYAFISEKAISAFNGRIAAKRKEQLEYIRVHATNVSLGLKEIDIKEAIADGIIRDYGMKPAQLLKKLAAGETVRNRKGRAFVAGVGSPKVYNIDSNTGFPSGADMGQEGTAYFGGEKFYKVQDTEAGFDEAVFNDSGQQVAYNDGKGWKSGQSNTSNFWSWAHVIISGIARLLEAIGKFFGGGKSIDELRAYQQDGFYMNGLEPRQKAGSGLLLPILVGCGLAYMIATSEGDEKKNDDKKQ